MVSGILSIIPYSLLLLGPYRWLSAPEELQAKSIAIFTLAMFGVSIPIVIANQLGLFGDPLTKVSLIALVGGLFQTLGWVGVAKYIGHVAKQVNLPLMENRGAGMQ